MSLLSTNLMSGIMNPIRWQINCTIPAELCHSEVGASRLRVIIIDSIEAYKPMLYHIRFMNSVSIN